MLQCAVVDVTVIVIMNQEPTLVLQHLVVHLGPFLGAHLAPCLNHPGIHSGNEDPCTGHAHQVPTDESKTVNYTRHSLGVVRDEIACISGMQMFEVHKMFL